MRVPFCPTCPTLSHLSHFVPAVGQVGTAQLAVLQHINLFCPILSQNKTTVGQDAQKGSHRSATLDYQRIMRDVLLDWSLEGLADRSARRGCERNNHLARSV